ncbi:MAG: hypothetical protein ACRD0K_10160 [Egibacteraceae bacterium]
MIRYRNRPRGRRRHRRNPALFKGGTRGIVSQLTRGVVNGTWVLVGEAATNALPSLVGMNQAGVMGMAVKAVAATVAGMLAKQFVGANAADYVTAGGFAALVRPTIKALNIPVLSGALGDTFPEYFMGAYAREEQIGAYAQESGELDAALLYS